MFAKTGSTRRLGLTLIETIFLIAVISIITFLVVRWVRLGRQSSTDLARKANLMQLANAVAGYESLHGCYPCGLYWLVPPGKKSSEEQLATSHGTMVAILPFIEQTALYAAINFDHNIRSIINSTVAGTSIRTLQCPADPLISQPAELDNSQFQTASPPTGRHIIYRSSYAGVAGPWVTNTWRVPGLPGDQRSSYPEALKNQLGIFNVSSFVSTLDVHDGLSNTLLFGERSLAFVAADTRSSIFWWTSGNHGDTLLSTMFPLLNSDRAYPAAIGPLAPSSLHVPGVNFAFADGSVRTIARDSSSISRAIVATEVPHQDIPHIQGWLVPEIQAIPVGPRLFWDTIFALRPGASFTLLQKLSTRSGDEKPTY